MSSIAVRPKKDLEKQLFHQLAEILLVILNHALKRLEFSDEIDSKDTDTPVWIIPSRRKNISKK